MNVAIRQLTSTTVTAANQSLQFPQGVGRVTASLFTIPPGAKLPVHKHPFPRMGYILEGEIEVEGFETGRTAKYGAGTFVLEAVDLWHEGRNKGDVPARLLVIDLTDDSVTTNIAKPE